MEAIARTSLSGAPPGAALAAVMFAAAVHLIAPRPAAAGIGTLAPLDFNDRATNHVNYGGDSPDPWGHHSGRYDWNYYWTLMPPEIYSPPRPWRWMPFTMQLRRFPYSVPYHHMTGLIGDWTYDYRANAALLLNLFPDYVNRRVTTETRALHFAAYKQALDAGVGDTITWNASNVTGSVTTTREGWSGRRYCREFRQDIYIYERPQQAVGTVCRERAGEWQIAPNQ